MEGSSPWTVEGKCLVVFSFCCAHWALLKFYDGLLCSFEANRTFCKFPEAGNWIPGIGQDVSLMVRSKMRGNLQRRWKPGAFLSDKGLTHVFHTWKDISFQRANASGAEGRCTEGRWIVGFCLKSGFCGLDSAEGGTGKYKCMLFNHNHSCQNDFLSGIWAFIYLY